MGAFRVVVDATGGHGCQRSSSTKQDGPIYWCLSQSCPDCITREFVEKMAKTQSGVSAKLLHWPDSEHEVVDTFVIKHPSVSSWKDKDGVEHHYVVPMEIYRTRSKPM